ncbi:hypothetical protein SERLADRAFT_364859 [Serpula lacrymans var. lacrymans S7.9]|uniref:Uncharacterized protein n=1 Tax=Serpula lacrymans var. lacrymans (strain S7.9) TaxID=578457 RepID=F8NEW3_SERL9|nr:uncharacterized protein SERLADRAFT_364859 [Serpula lacrymans var. lacrymans S7.9]EGO31111.1 hypothetical protein SERLADRAFT_364859 [Serpula lacrymans var. lacrymans S7.9]
MYHGLQNMVQTDLDHVANLLSELEPLEEGEGGMQSSCVKEAADTSGVSKCPVAHGVRRDSHPPDIIQPRSCRKRRRSSTVNSVSRAWLITVDD